MQKTIKILIAAALLMFFSQGLMAEVKVTAAYPYIKSITEIIGGENVSVKSLARGDRDPHFVVPRPSLAAIIRRADLLIINGASLEAGWLAPVIRDSRNRNIQPGTNGYLDLSHHVGLIDKPAVLTRDHGDVHPEGNPHFALDPHNIPPAARAITAALSEIDPDNSGIYRDNLDSFLVQWNKKLQVWDKKLSGLDGKKVIQYHKTYNYLIRRYGMIPLAEIEPQPGIPPTSRHMKKIIDIADDRGADFIMADVYHPGRPVKYISSRSGLKIITIPHDVGAVEEATDIFGLFDTIVERLSDD